MALSSKEKAYKALNLLAFGLFANLYNILTLLYSQSKMRKNGDRPHFVRKRTFSS
jgi:hypothetical protein